MIQWRVLLACTLLMSVCESATPKLRWVASVVAAEAVRDYSDTALLLYGARLGSVSFLLLGTRLPSRVSGAPRHHSRYAAQTNIQRYRIETSSSRPFFSTMHPTNLVKGPSKHHVSLDTRVILD